MRDVISGQHGQVRLQVVRHSHCFIDALFVQKRAVMNIGKLDDAETVEFDRKFFDGYSLIGDLNLMRLDHRRPQDCGECLSPLSATTATFGLARKNVSFHPALLPDYYAIEVK